jgi:hypothetical protein
MSYSAPTVIGEGLAMAQHSELERANSQHALPDLDVRYITRSMALQYGRADWYCKPGWYRHRHPASNATGWVTSGPFKSEAEALADADS